MNGVFGNCFGDVYEVGWMDGRQFCEKLRGLMECIAGYPTCFNIIRYNYILLVGISYYLNCWIIFYCDRSN